MTEQATAATGQDFNDAASDLGDEAIAASINAAIPQAKFPSGFKMNAKGLFLEHEDGPRHLTGPFEVMAQTRDRHSQSWGLLIRWTDDDDQIHRIAIARSLLAGDGLAVRQMLIDGGLYVTPRPVDRAHLQQFLSMVKIDRRARAVSRIGWSDGVFALPDRTIESGAGDLVVYQGTAALDHDYREQGTLEEWKEGVAKLAAGNSRVVIAICSAFVGPLLEAVGAEGGGLHLRGESSIGKSTALNAAASVWGRPAFVRSWRSTANGLEGVAELANDSLLILDELAQLDPNDAGNVAYLLANGCGKSRASQTGEARAAKRWLTFFLSSGEISLAEHARSDGRGRRSPAGQEVRILDIEADAGKGLGLFDTLNGFAGGDQLSRAIKDNAATHYGLAGPAFVRSLLGQLDSVASRVRDGIDWFAKVNLPDDATGQVARAGRRFGLIAMAGELAITEGILPWEKGEALNAAKSVFAGWIEARGGSGAAEDTAAIEQVAEFISTHGASRFQAILRHNIAAEAEPAGEVRPIYNRAGFRRDTEDGTEYLIPTTTWRNEVCRGLSPKRVAKLMVDRGHIIPDSAGKASRVETVPEMGKARFYIVNQSIFGGDDDA